MKLAAVIVVMAATGALLAAAWPLGSAAADERGPGGDGRWRTDPLWDDGNAEFAAYAVSWPRYGRTWKGRALLVVVKEPWAPDLDVKADRPRADGFDVLKLNHARDVGTGIYAYHQMASAFVRRDDGHLRKLAVTSSEACGLTTATLTGGTLVTSSYFDGQGVRETAWPEGALPEDALPLALRDHVRGAVPERVSILPSLMAGRLPPLRASAWTLAREDAGVVDVRAGRFPAVRLRLRKDAGEHRLVFEAAAPHRLLTWEQADGTRYELAKVDRLAYWTLNRPGNETWWPEDLR